MRALQFKNGTTIATVLFALAITLVLAVSYASIASAAGPTCAVPSEAYPSIQAAVDDATCATVNVAAGTYAEHVSVARAVVLNGANAGVSATASRSAESIVDGTDTGAPFSITANDVTIDGFTVTNGSNGGLDAGVWSQTGTTNSSIRNNIITGNDFGVWAQCGGNCLIEDNLFDANNKPGSGSGSASISADSTTGLTIRNNEFKNDTAGNPILLQGTAAGAHHDITVSGNTFHDNTQSAIYALAVTGGTFTGNTITPASDGTGISLSGADADITVSGNTIEGGARGVRIEDAGYYGDAGANGTITLNRNSVATDSEYGIGVIGTSTTVDATCNWWGAADGPGAVGPGAGSPVTANIDYATWLTTSDLNGSCNGTTQAAGPVISGTATSTTSTGATITWTTDLPATGQVSYGLTTTYTASSTLQSATTTSHTVTLAGLTPSTTYHYQIQSGNGNATTTSSDATFMTTAAATGTAPVISNVMTTQNGTSSETIKWTTDTEATGYLSYGTTTAYGASTTPETTASTTHSVTINGLSEATVYHYQITATNDAGTTTTTDATFASGSTASSTPLTVTSVDSERGTATADGSFSNGFQWLLHYVVPDNETYFQMKFADFTMASSSATIPAAHNIRIYSAQSDNATSTESAIVSTNNDYGTALHLTGDAATGAAGRQVDVTVEVAVPVGTTPGQYSTTFGTKTSTTTTP